MSYLANESAFQAEEFQPPVCPVCGAYYVWADWEHDGWVPNCRCEELCCDGDDGDNGDQYEVVDATFEEPAIDCLREGCAVRGYCACPRLRP